jgi:aminopeptidase N
MELIKFLQGAALLRMVEHVMGEDAFNCAIRQYICRFAAKTATTNDLLIILQNVRPDLNLREFMESYLYQNEYPIFHVDEENDDYVLTQNRCKKDQQNEIPLEYFVLQS